MADGDRDGPTSLAEARAFAAELRGRFRHEAKHAGVLIEELAGRLEKFSQALAATEDARDFRLWLAEYLGVDVGG